MKQTIAPKNSMTKQTSKSQAESLSKASKSISKKEVNNKTVPTKAPKYKIDAIIKDNF
jgi:hypothetical protein